MAYHEVNAAIYSEYYKDETVLLKDLLTPQTSALYQTQKFKDFNPHPGEFKKEFFIQLNKGDYSHLKKAIGFEDAQNNSRVQEYIDTAMEIFSNSAGANIYFPYSENFFTPLTAEYFDNINTDPFGDLATVIPADREADSAPGGRPYKHKTYDANGEIVWEILYQSITVNDYYAENFPTHIVGVGAEYATNPPPPPPPPPGISRVYIGEGVCKEQYDRLISFTGNGGGSEIRYCHLTGYLQPVNGQVTTFQDIAPFDFTRKNINKKKWIRLFLVWDDDWVQDDLEQVFGIYEEDNANTRTFTGSVGTTASSATGPVQASIGFSVTVQSQDEIIRQLKISRNSYFSGAFQNQGQDFSPDATFLPLPYTHGWPAYDVHYWNKSGANVGWTWPYNTF